MYIQVLLSIAPGAMQWRTHVVGALALTFQSETFGPRLLTAALLAALPLGSWARPGQQRVLVPVTAGRSGLRNPWCTGVTENNYSPAWREAASCTDGLFQT